MPHQCTNCGRAFDDGSKQMLSGCPDCGGNKFQFLPAGAVDGAGSDGGSAARTAETPGGTDGPAATPADVASADPPEPATDDDIIEAPPEPIDDRSIGEDRAQASARSDVVARDELPPPPDPGEREPPAEERPDLADLRAELNAQFESIKILKPGEYELNLMELYDRDEYIIALEEDGRYVIDVPEHRWQDEE